MVGSRSFHLGLLHLQCALRGPELDLGDFEQPGLTGDAKQASLEDVREERRGANMGHTILIAIYSPLYIVGMVLLIMWWMSGAGSHSGGYRPNESERVLPRKA